MYVTKRSGFVVAYDRKKIEQAVTKAFISTRGNNFLFKGVSDKLVYNEVHKRLENQYQEEQNKTYTVEAIQDLVENVLLDLGHRDVAKSYMIYRDKHTQYRKELSELKVTLNTGEVVTPKTVFSTIKKYSDVLNPNLKSHGVDLHLILNNYKRDVYYNMKEEELNEVAIKSVCPMIELGMEYSFLASYLRLDCIYSEYLDVQLCKEDLSIEVKQHVISSTFELKIKQAVVKGLISPKLLDYDFDKLKAAFNHNLDFLFEYMGMQILYDRYLLKTNGVVIETPQTMFMRIAMGLALNEENKEEKAIEFYKTMANHYAMPSTPTLFNSGTVKSQLSSCYVSTTSDDLENIYDTIKDNAMLSKYAGGLGNDWTNVRALGSLIKGTNGNSQGVIPFLKVVNDTAVAVNQGGKRKGAVCCYLETWHLDIEEFLDLRKNTGDDRRRTHDMNTANWIPDLFMKRVEEDSHWTLFSPSDTPDLHDLYGNAFELAYENYEKNGLGKRIRAKDLWRKMLTSLYETGHPWITFKDTMNHGNTQKHIGVIHSSNLCTEIALVNSKDEIAVCNLASINLKEMLVELTPNENNQYHLSLFTEEEDTTEIKRKKYGINLQKLNTTIHTVINMLDNGIDLNFYPVEKTRTSNLRHRPIGMGIMGLQDILYMLGINFDSELAVTVSGRLMAVIQNIAISASSKLALTRGVYPSYEGSEWSKCQPAIRVRNSNILAIAPTATIANIIGVYQSIEPAYQNIYVKSNLSGEFTQINKYLVEDLKALGIYNNEMIKSIKKHDGDISKINEIPEELRNLYKTAFQIDSKWVILAAAARQESIDQAQSVNLYLHNPTGKKLNDVYMMAWKMGLKTTYYLRTLATHHGEKSTGDGGDLLAVKVCSIDNPDCESCQ